MNERRHTSSPKKGGMLHEIEEHNIAFSLAFLGIFTATFVFLLAVGATPDPTSKWKDEHGGQQVAQSTPVQSTSTTAINGQGELPVRIVIDGINLSASISNPSSTNIEVLDNQLLSGAVRYPTSGLLGVNGTVLLFGHSSYLPIVHNQAYKTFDGIQNLKTGEEISVYSSDREYRYRVAGVRMANAQDNDQNTIALPSDAQHLTLVTCDSFGTKSDRYIVTADLVGTYSLAS
jgi:LPXTG-site transpeptidase (sortase) family protein